MSTLAASDATITAAHVVHYTVLAAGLVGLVGLLAPGVVGRRPVAHESAPRDEHEIRVRALRAHLAAGGAAPPVEPPAPALRAPDRVREVAVLASIVAAVVHAAVCPEHFEESFLFGVFFAVSALAQLGWAGLALRRPSPPVWVVGAVGNFLVVALWTVTRVEGLPFGLLPEPEAVGPWDLMASTAEVVVVLACVLAVRRGAAAARVRRSSWSGAPA